MRTTNERAKKVYWKSNVVQATRTTALGIVRFVHSHAVVATTEKAGEGNHSPSEKLQASTNQVPNELRPKVKFQLGF